jgi:hypothetical protein
VAKAEKKGKDTARTKTAKTPAKAGEKRTFDLSSLDEAHRKDMADSACRQDSCIDLEVKRTELQLERERNKKRKLDFDAERLRMDHEDRRERMRREEERDNRFFGFMSGMMGVGAGMSMGGPVSQFGMQGQAGSSMVSSSSSLSGDLGTLPSSFDYDDLYKPE